MQSGVVEIGEKRFKMLYTKEQIESRILEIANELSNLEEEFPLFLPVLNGAYYFSSDLLRNINYPYQLLCLLASSYKGMDSSGDLQFQGVKEVSMIKDRKIFILEDIVESGNTAHGLMEYLYELGAEKVEVITLFFKPQKLNFDIPVRIAGFVISDAFIVGYGLDYNEDGRYLNHVYQLIE